MATADTTLNNTNSQTGSQLLTVKDAASFLQVHPETIRRYIREGRLKSVKVGSSITSPVRILRSSFEEFIHGGNS